MISEHLKVLLLTSAGLTRPIKMVDLELPFALKDIKRKFSVINERRPEIEDMAQLSNKFLAASSQNKWSLIKKKDWRKLPWLFWDDSNHLIMNRGIVERYIAIVRETATSRFIKTLIFVYLSIYPPESAATNLIRKLIIDSLDRFDKGTLLTWKERQNLYGLFSGQNAEKKLTQEILGGNVKVDAVLENAGLTGMLGSTGLSRATYRYALKTVARIKPSDSELLSSYLMIMKWSVDEGKLRYPAERITLIDSLLLPWKNDDPPDQCKEKVFKFLMGQFDDPRINKAKWQGIDEDSRAVIIKWLVKETLEDFFRILDKTAMDHHWRYRHSFWLAYHEKSAIDAAWIALGPDARIIARQVFEKGFSAAQLVGSGIQDNHSVLMMKIGNLIIAEWSHNGKCRAWYTGDPHAPNMYLGQYNRRKLTEYSNQIVQRYVEPGISHAGSENGHWQGMLSSYIRDETGISVTSAEYMRGV